MEPPKKQFYTSLYGILYCVAISDTERSAIFDGDLVMTQVHEYRQKVAKETAIFRFQVIVISLMIGLGFAAIACKPLVSRCGMNGVFTISQATWSVQNLKALPQYCTLRVVQMPWSSITTQSGFPIPRCL
jgi:hypothetical protein